MLKKDSDVVDIVAIKLITGETLIARQADEFTLGVVRTYLRVEKPLELCITSVGRCLKPWLLCEQRHYTMIERTAIVAVAVVTGDIINEYLRQIGEVTN